MFQIRCYSSKSDEEKVIPKNLIEDKITAKHQPNGPIVDNKPFKITLQAGQFSRIFKKIPTELNNEIIIFG